MRHVTQRHRLYVHPINEMSVSGVMFLSCGLSLIAFAYNNFLLSGLFSLLAVLLQLHLFSDIWRPCSCNRVPLLTVQERRKMASKKQCRWLLLYPFFFCLAGVLTGPTTLAFIVSIGFLAYGSFSCGIAISRKFDWYLQTKIVYGFDSRRVSDLNLSKPNDIQEIVNVSISAGNLVLAEKYSADLIKMLLEPEKE